MSVNYYTRLEQGRERHPSLQVLDALSRALDLRPDAHEHLHRLAGTAPGYPGRPQMIVRPDILELIEEWTTTPALVLTETLDILAQNHLAQALHSGFTDPANLALMTFLDPVGSAFFVDWQRVAQGVTENLRLAQGRRPHDPRLLELVATLSESSTHFRLLWADHDVRGKTYEAKRFEHPAVGPLELTYQAFDIRGSDGQQLLVYKAQRGSRTADSLRLLASLATSRTQL